MEKTKKSKILLTGIFKENPSLVMFLGMCPTLAVTTKIDDAIGMTAAVMFVLLLSNISVSFIRKLVPDEVRIPVYIVIIASFVKIIDMLMQAYTPALSQSLGLFIPLIVVNCVILGRAEAFASKNTVVDSIFDAIGMSLGFGLSLFVLAAIRQFFGTGGLSLSNPLNPEQIIFSFNLFKDQAMSFLTMPAGAFLVFGLVVAIVAAYQNYRADKKTKHAAQTKA